MKKLLWLPLLITFFFSTVEATDSLTQALSILKVKFLSLANKLKEESDEVEFVFAGTPDKTKTVNVGALTELDMTLKGNEIPKEFKDFDWAKLKEIKNLNAWTNLEEINLNACPELESLDVSDLANLKTLTALDCKKLNNINGLKEAKGLQKIHLKGNLVQDIDISGLYKLKQIGIFDCKMLKKITGLNNAETQKFTNLSLIILDGCTELNATLGTGTNEMNLGAIETLKTLNLLGCGNLRGTLDFTNLNTLISFSAAPNINVKGLDGKKFITNFNMSKNKFLTKDYIYDKESKIVSLKKFVQFVFAGTPDKTETVNVGALTELDMTLDEKKIPKEFKDFNWAKLKEIKNLNAWTNLKKIKLSNCPELESLDVSDLANLKTLTALDCKKLNNINGLKEAKGLQIIHLKGNLVQDIDISGLYNLNQIGIFDCKMLKKITGLNNAETQKFTKLSLIILDGCTELNATLGTGTNEMNLGAIKTLKTLNLLGCGNLRGTLDFTNLNTLISFSAAPNINVKGLDGKKFITNFNMSENEFLTKDYIYDKESKIVSLKKFVQFVFEDTPDTTETVNVGAITELDTSLDEKKIPKEFKDFKWAKLKEIKNLNAWTNLKEINLNACPELESLDVSDLATLEKLTVSNCMAFDEIKGLNKATALLELGIFQTNIKSLDVSALINLKKLIIKKCMAFDEIKGLDKTTALLELDIHQTSIKSLDVSNLINLKNLIIKKCLVFGEIKGLDKTTALIELDIHQTNIKSLDVSALINLKKLDVNSCEKLVSIIGLNSCKALKILRIDSCNNLKQEIDLTNITLLKPFSPFKSPGITVKGENIKK